MRALSLARVIGVFTTPAPGDLAVPWPRDRFLDQLFQGETDNRTLVNLIMPFGIIRLLPPSQPGDFQT